ncbi:MAG TPA: hypothetical protein VLJ37_06650 [bacterium]|nr:hypothetical protein [bacterium]
MPPPLTGDDGLLRRTGLPETADSYYSGVTVGGLPACGGDDTRVRRLVVGGTGSSSYIDFPEVRSLNPQFRGTSIDDPLLRRILTATGGLRYTAGGSGGRAPVDGMLHLCRDEPATAGGPNAIYVSDNAVINNTPANNTPLFRLPVPLEYSDVSAIFHSGVIQPGHLQIEPAGLPNYRYVNIIADVTAIDRVIAFVERSDSPIPAARRPAIVTALRAVRPRGEDFARDGLEMQRQMRTEMRWQIIGSTIIGAGIGLYGIMLASNKAGPINNAVSAPFRGLYNLLRAPFDRGEGLARFWRDMTSPFRYRGIPTLLKVGNNMTEQARLGEFRPVADPTTPMVAEQIENTINSRFNTMSVLVEGPPGWGKEEVMRTLSLRNPNTIYIRVTPNGMMGGTMYRGQLEERLTDIPREIARARKNGQQVVLFVDEFHEALSAGRSMESTTSLLEHWKGELARGELRIVGFSTPRELLKARYIAGIYNDPATRARLSPEFREEVERFERDGVHQNLELRPLLNRFQPLVLPARPASDIEVILRDTIEARRGSGLAIEMNDATIRRIAELSASPLASEGHIPRTAFAIFNGVVDAHTSSGSPTVRVTTAMIDGYVQANYPDIAQRFHVTGGTPPPSAPPPSGLRLVSDTASDPARSGSDSAPRVVSSSVDSPPADTSGPRVVADTSGGGNGTSTGPRVVSTSGVVADPAIVAMPAEAAVFTEDRFVELIRERFPEYRNSAGEIHGHFRSYVNAMARIARNRWIAEGCPSTEVSGLRIPRESLVVDVVRQFTEAAEAAGRADAERLRHAYERPADGYERRGTEDMPDSLRDAGRRVFEMTTRR